MEEWRDVEGYEGLYKISSYGNVYGIRSKKMLKQKDNKGYLMVNLYKDNHCKTFAVHRIVAKKFVPNREGKREVNHIDENKKNNKASNLEWVTPKENANWGSRNKRISEYVRSHPGIGFCRNSRKLKQIDPKSNEVINIYNSISEVCKIYGYHQGNISECCLGKRNKANGYKWEFVD